MEKLLGSSIIIDEFDRRLDWVKGELKHYDPETGTIRIELNDTNRPDLWSVEGIVRQLLGGQSPSKRPWSQMISPTTPLRSIRVDPTVFTVRPYIGGFLAKGPGLGEEGLRQLISSQEKLSDLFGRKRQDIAIGVYPAKNILFPVTYEAVSPDEHSFTPLGQDSPMTLSRIVQEHPKGKEYGHLLSPHSLWTILRDQGGKILSMPPVTNARHTGEVTAEDDWLFVEATGHDQERIRLVMNIMAANLFDRGFQIEPILVDDSRGKTQNPQSAGDRILVPGNLPSEVSGEAVLPQDFIRALLSYGYPSIQQQEKGFLVTVPFMRDDVLHPIDCVEDYLIARGFDSLTPVMPTFFTPGRAAKEGEMEDRVRSLMAGIGFQEILSNILTETDSLSSALGRPTGPIVEIDNPISRQYGALRSTFLSQLMNAEALSSRFPYPHRIFEVGEAAEKEGSPSTIRETILFTALVAHPTASVSEVAGIIVEVLRYLGLTAKLVSKDIPPYIKGRSAEIFILEKPDIAIGELGEIDPETLDIFGIRMPTSMFEVRLDRILRPLPPTG
jgi:phenylalanyl-tRNA synthetase beta chain